MQTHTIDVNGDNSCICGRRSAAKISCRPIELSSDYHVPSPVEERGINDQEDIFS